MRDRSRLPSSVWLGPCRLAQIPPVRRRRRGQKPGRVTSEIECAGKVMVAAPPATAAAEVWVDTVFGARLELSLSGDGPSRVVTVAVAVAVTPAKSTPDAMSTFGLRLMTTSWMPAGVAAETTARSPVGVRFELGSAGFALTVASSRLPPASGFINARNSPVGWTTVCGPGVVIAPDVANGAAPAARRSLPRGRAAQH